MHFLRSSITSRPESVTNLTLSREVATFLFEVGIADLYAGGSQHTRRSHIPPWTSQIHPSSRNLSNISRDGGTRSSAAHDERCWGGIGKTPWSVTMDLWSSKKEQDDVGWEVSHSKRQSSCFVDLASVASQTRTMPRQSLVSSRVPSAAQA